MTLIYGLGNNENKYLNTKHNVGRIIVENIAKKMSLNFVETKKCMVAKNDDFWFVYSKGYMNNIGEPLSELLKYYKIDLTKNFELVVIQDDSDQSSSSLKLCAGGGSAGHNGIISVYRELAFLGLEQSKIWRLKIGIRPEGNKQKSETFVLSKNCDLDLKCINLITNKLHLNLELMTINSFDRLQKIMNTKS
jgi:peptidyl-tRNA hydrolase, PTH1 family